MKVGISDGCANGGMMDSLDIHPLEDEPDWEPYYTVEVTAQKWEEWQSFLKLHNKWERFWDNKMFPPKPKKAK